MKLVSYADYRIGAVTTGGIVDLSSVLPDSVRFTPWGMNWLIENFEEVGDQARDIENTETAGSSLEEVYLRSPVPRPTNVFAAPMNYEDHVDETVATGRLRTEDVRRTVDDLGFFLKSSSSVIGQSDTILLPQIEDRAFHHEPELGLVLRTTKAPVAPADWRDAVFGYTCILDITLRNTLTHTLDRSLRKSFGTFTPVGPVIVTSDEIPDPGNLDVRLWVDDQLRQHANTKDLIVGIPELTSFITRVASVQSGDLVATGTPGGVGPIVPGNQLTMEVAGVGKLSLPVGSRPWFAPAGGRLV
ncbi:fumarylacetoacetate hydrolase family protein [Microbacterium sp. A94]|uniref:fumarylacetoacetate hydrolase family protein n=1 Tax=Microbacterium sp. A94 TaxID=3450717 RepID=UPI003F42EC43